MDYVEGIDLTTFLEQHPEPMQPGEAIALALQILYALQIVHGAGVAHNDLKPANIMLDENNPTGKVTLIDFGQGTFMRNSNELPGLTSRYTAHYSAPEVRAGVSAGPRSDLYSVGIILCDLLRVGLRRNGSPADLTPPVTTPKELWDVILKATGSLAHRGSGAARSSHHGAADEEIVRYEDAAQIIAALQALLPPETGQPHSNPPAAQAGTSPSKSPTSTSKAPGATPASIAFLLALFEGHIENAVARGKRGLWWEMGIGASLGTLSVLWSVLGLPYAIFPALAIMLATLLYSDVHIGIEEQISVERGLSPPRWGDRLVRLVVLMLYVISGFVLVLVHWLHGNIPPKVQVDGWIMLAFAPLIHYAYDHWQFHRFEAARVAEAKRREYVNGQGKDNWAVLPVPNTDRLRDVGNKELEARRRQWLEPLMRRDASIYALGILEQNNPDLKYVYVYNGLSGTDQAIEPVPVPFDKAFKKKVFEGTILYDDADGRGLWINLGAAPAAGNSDITFLGAGVNFFAFLAALLSGKSTFNHGDYLTPEANTDWHKIRNEYRTAFRKIFSLILGGTWRRGLAPVINFVIHMAPLTNGWKTFRRALAALCSNCRPTFQAKLAAAA
jgi:hypothetical protein